MRQFAVLALVLVLPVLCMAQSGVRYDNIAFRYTSLNTVPAPGATITVCNASGPGCPSLASIFSDAGLSSPQSNPFLADSFGNFGFYAASGSTYRIQVSGPTLQTYLLTWVAPLVSGGAVSFSTINGPTTFNGNDSFPGNNTLAGNNTFSGTNSHTGAETFTGPINLTGAGSAAVQTALNGLVAGQTYLLPCGTYTGPTSIPSNVSLISMCPSFVQDFAQTGGNAIAGAKTIFTYSAQLTLTSLVNVRLQGISLDFADSGFGVTLSNDFGFEWSYLNLHECGNTTTPCLLITTNGTAGGNNSAWNHFDHMYIKCNTSVSQNAIGIQLVGQGPVNNGSFATDNTFDNVVISGFVRMAVDSELNSDSNYFHNLAVFQTIASPVANTAVLVFNNNTPGSDQDADGSIYDNVSYTGPSWHGIRGGTSAGNVVRITSNASDIVVAGGTVSLSEQLIGLGTTVSEIASSRLSSCASFNPTCAATGSSAGDVTAARSATAGIAYLGGDGNGLLSRSSNSLTASYGTNGVVFPSSNGFTLTTTIASGTAAMTTAAITAGNCGTTVTVAAANVATTDTITWAFNAAPAGSNAGLVGWPTSGNVNFAYCPNSAETPAAATINWRVVR